MINVVWPLYTYVQFHKICQVRTTISCVYRFNRLRNKLSGALILKAVYTFTTANVDIYCSRGMCAAALHFTKSKQKHADFLCTHRVVDRVKEKAREPRGESH